MATSSGEANWRRIIVLKVCYLQMVDADPISGTTYIEEESLWTTSDDFVGPGIWQGERRTMTVSSDKEVGCRGQLSWNVGRLGVCMFA